MAYFAAILHMEKPELNEQFRGQHLDYLTSLDEAGKIFARGPFVDGSGGMVIYIAGSLAEAKELAEKDPYVIEGVRRLELHEWGKS
ncbi:YciI family protein [Bacillus sp. AK128]